MKILRRFEEDGYEITEYTIDGENVSHREERLPPSNKGDSVSDPPQPTLEERVEQLQMDNTILLMALTDAYEEIQTLKGGND